MKLRLIAWYFFVFCKISTLNLAVDLQADEAEILTSIHKETPNSALPELKKNGLNILFVVSSFPTISETFVLNQITGLLDRGCNVFIYALTTGNFKIVHQDYYTYRLAQKTIYDLEENALRKVKSVPFDIVLCHFGPMGYRGHELITKLSLKAKLCTFFHGFDMSILVKQNTYIYNDLFKLLDIAFPISNHWKNKLLELGCNPKKIIVHHMGIDTHRFSFKPRTLAPNEKLKCISIARLVEKKGIKYAIQAFAQVAKKYANIEYTIVGDGLLKASLQAIINELDLKDKVNLVGWQPQEKVAQLLDNSHILIAPSITGSNNDKEGIPVAMMEAMAMGIPVISTYHSGIPELVEDGVTGLLVQERDISGLAEKMLTLINNPERRQEMGRAGRKKVEESFEISTLNNQLIATFYKMLKNN